MNVKQAAIETGISIKDINQLIAHGRIPRPVRGNSGWELTEHDIQTLKEVPRDMLPSFQRMARRDSFWRNALSGVEISGSAITLAKAAIENPDLEHSHTNEIMNNYAKEFVVWYKSCDPEDLSRDERKVFDRIFDTCQGYVELQEALNLVSRREMLTTRQLSLVCDTTPTVIRKLWNDRRISPRTQNYSGHLMWDSDTEVIDDIKNHIAGVKELPVQRIQARRDILHFSIIDIDNDDSGSLESKIRDHFESFGGEDDPEGGFFDFVSSKLKQLGVIGGYYYPTEEDFTRIQSIINIYDEESGFDFERLQELVTSWI